MKRLEIVTYSYKQHLDEADLRALTKVFVERGSNPGVIAQYERLDGRGGFILQEVTPEADLESVYERMLAYSVYMDFEVISVTTMEDAVPTILKMYA